jgi:uncharacterized membrane protein
MFATSSERMLACLAYLLGAFSGTLIALIERRSRFVLFHAAQSILVFGFLGLAQLPLLFLAMSSLAVALSGKSSPEQWFVHNAGLGAGFAGVAIVQWGFLIFLVVCACRGKMPHVPIAGRIADRLIGQDEELPARGPVIKLGAAVLLLLLMGSYAASGVMIYQIVAAMTEGPRTPRIRPEVLESSLATTGHGWERSGYGSRYVDTGGRMTTVLCRIPYARPSESAEIEVRVRSIDFDHDFPPAAERIRVRGWPGYSMPGRIVVWRGPVEVRIIGHGDLLSLLATVDLDRLAALEP